jgi:predicted transcriptional regulator
MLSLKENPSGGTTMRTWEDYKNHVKSISEEERRNMEKIEEVSNIVSSIIRRRQELGISQRTLAERCGIPQSSIARIETLKTTPKLDTLVKLMRALNLKLQVASVG